MAPSETENNVMQNFGVTNKEHCGMLWYFLGWPIFVHHGGADGEARNIVQTSQRIWTPTFSRVMIGINESFLRVFCIFDERMRAITNVESVPGF